MHKLSYKKIIAITGIFLLSACMAKNGISFNHPSDEMVVGDMSGAIDTEKKIDVKYSPWSYNDETGPDNWGNLKDEYKLCKHGKMQSPINIDAREAPRNEDIKFHYTSLDALNNGHTLKVKYDPRHEVSIMGHKYKFVQLHFHAPAEHTIGNKYYPAEVHLVHMDDKGNYAVVGAFITEGRSNPFLRSLLNEVPPHQGEKKALNDLSMIDLIHLIPQDRRYYRYIGSLTTPPCTEGVRWNLFRMPVEASKDEIEGIKKLMVPNNNRPVAPLNDRKIH